MLFYGGMKVAVMQPYFFPYLGYFRLIEESDIFVVYDCVQFPRRGWVHRNMPEHGGQWLTLPLAKCDLETRIKDVLLSEDYGKLMERRLGGFPAIKKKIGGDSFFRELIIDRKDRSLLSLLMDSLDFCCENLELDFHHAFSSELGLDDSLKGEDRILSICEYFGASEYINSPSGKELYSPEKFQESGVEINFLEPWQGSFDSVLTMMLLGSNF